MIRRTIAVLALVVLTTASRPPFPDLRERFAARLEQERDELIQLRRDIHRHPELSGQEQRTAGLVADRLAGLGLEVRRGVGGHGVVAILRGGGPGPRVAFRADMDAVRSTAPDPVPFASEVPGVRHICGHDVHTTIGLALAEGLAVIRDDLVGSVVLLFQPAEETATGARAMIADGALDDLALDAIYAFHTAPYETGQVATARGVMMPARNRATVTITNADDPAAIARAAAEMLRAIGTVASPFASEPIQSDFIAANARADRDGDGGWLASAVFTTATDNATDHARAQALDIVEQLAARHPEARLQLRFEPRWVAGVRNDPELAARATRRAQSVLGADAVHTLTQVVPAFSEDFGSFQELVPGVMFFLGVSNAAQGWVGMPHSPDYVADEEAVFVGARVMAAILLDHLGGDGR